MEVTSTNCLKKVPLTSTPKTFTIYFLLAKLKTYVPYNFTLNFVQWRHNNRLIDV